MAGLLTRRSNLLPSLFEETEPLFSRSLWNWDPFREFSLMSPSGSMPRMLPENLISFSPAVQVKETPTTFEVKADVPGIKEEDLEVSLSGNRLILSGKREAERKEETETYHTYERTFGSFTRTFNLPEEVDTSKVAAELKEGVLNITVPKLPEARAKNIKIATK